MADLPTTPPLPTPTLTTERLRLRPVEDRDVEDLWALHTDPRVLRWWDAPPWRDRARAERFVAASRRLAEDGTGARVVLERLEDGAFLGWCALVRWDATHRSAALGYCLPEAAWGQGYATEAARALLQWGFDTLDLHRVQAETDTRNAASARVLAKLGFRREGTLREDCVVDGEVSSSHVHGLLRREWGAPGATFRTPQVVLLAADVERSTAFWRGAGFEEVFRTPAEGTPIHVDLVLDGYRLGLASVASTRDDHGLEPVATGQRAAVVLWTDDTPAAWARLQELGARPVKAPSPWLGRLIVAWVEDLDGHLVQVVQTT